MKDLVSILIINYNNYMYTIECLKSLKNQSYPNFEIILLDNGSKYADFLQLRKEIGYLEMKSKIKLIRNERNLYFAPGNNKIIKMANGKYICLLNYDAIIPNQFIESMINFFEGKEKIGFISPKIKQYANKNLIFFAGGKVNFIDPRIVYLIGMGELDPYDNKYLDGYNSDFAVGTAMFFKKEILEQIGLMDESFLMYHEDVDWSIRAKMKGFKNFINPSVIIYHNIEVPRDRKRVLLSNYFCRRNVQILAWKHSSISKLIQFYISFSFFNFKELIKLFLHNKFKLNYIEIISFLKSVLHGFIIGVKKRTNKSIGKRMVNDYYFIRGIQEKKI